jgi:hypothetical protein
MAKIDDLKVGDRIALMTGARALKVRGGRKVQLVEVIVTGIKIETRKGDAMGRYYPQDAAPESESTTIVWVKTPAMSRSQRLVTSPDNWIKIS